MECFVKVVSIQLIFVIVLLSLLVSHEFLMDIEGHQSLALCHMQVLTNDLNIIILNSRLCCGYNLNVLHEGGEDGLG